MPVEVYEVVKNVKYKSMLSDLSEDLDRLCLTQGQIVSFCRNHQERLVPGKETLFLFKEDNQYFVAFVAVRSDGLVVFIQRIGHLRAWSIVHGLYVVVPQLGN